MKLSRLFLLGLLFSTAILNAQTDFRPGYIIKVSGDTIYGQIDYRGDLFMGEVCRFRNNDREDELRYSPADLVAYRFTESKYYVSQEINGAKVFLEFLIKGQINIYYLRDSNGDHYFLEKAGNPIIELPYEEGIKYVDGKKVFFRTKKHIGLLTYYMQDAPEFQARINEIGKPEHESLIKLSEDYHSKVCKDGPCIIYEKKPPFRKVNLEAVAGIVNFENAGDFNNGSYFQSGVIAHFWMPRTNEKIYFKTGLLYSRIEDTDGDKRNYIKVPTHIGYMAPNTYRIRPSVSIGLLSPSYSAGVAVKINKRINVGVQSWVNFGCNKVPWIPTQLINYSILGSFYIEL